MFGFPLLLGSGVRGFFFLEGHKIRIQGGVFFGVYKFPVVHVFFVLGMYNFGI